MKLAHAIAAIGLVATATLTTPVSAQPFHHHRDPATASVVFVHGQITDTLHRVHRLHLQHRRAHGHVEERAQRRWGHRNHRRWGHRNHRRWGHPNHRRCEHRLRANHHPRRPHVSVVPVHRHDSPPRFARREFREANFWGR